MNNFELSLEEGNPANIFFFVLDLIASPPKISAKALNPQKYIPLNSRVKNVQFKDAIFDEGFLNIYSCRFENGKCIVYLFGTMKGIRLKSEIEYKIETLRDFDLLNEKIKFILAKSKTILKSYYKESKIKNIEHHMLAFLRENPQS